MTSDKDLTLHFFYSIANRCMISTAIISLLGFPRAIGSSSVFKVVLGQIAKFERVESHRYEAILGLQTFGTILHPESTRSPGRWSVAGGWSGRIGNATWLASQNWLGGFHWLAKALQWDPLFQSIVIGLSGRSPSFIMNRAGQSSTLQVGASPFEDQLLSVLLEARSRRYGLGESSGRRCVCEVNKGEWETKRNPIRSWLF